MRNLSDRTGYMPAYRHLKKRDGADPTERLLTVYRRRPDALRRYTNLIVRANILRKIAAGHAHIVRGDLVALDYGAGRCTSTLVRA